jgi:hypothetical protein
MSLQHQYKTKGMVAHHHHAQQFSTQTTAVDRVIQMNKSESPKKMHLPAPAAKLKQALTSQQAH